MSDICNEIHSIFNKQERFSFPFTLENIPKNGIYILFEKGEQAQALDRIVRVGTHTGDNQLPSRLLQHFVTENKDRSIFRKNIGRALLHKRNDPYLKVWEYDLTPAASRLKYATSINNKRQKEIEKEVTEYMQRSFSFCVIEVVDKEKRLDLESKMISTLSLCEDCMPSKNWLGNFSPKQKIRESGLWLVNELYKEPLQEKNIGYLKNLL